MAISSVDETGERWSKRKAKTPIRSLSRLPSLPSSGRSSPTHQEAVPGVMIKFVGKMTKIDDVSTFSLRILHEQRGGLYSGTSASSLTDSFSSRSSTPPFLQSEQRQLLLKLPNQKSHRSRHTSSTHNSLQSLRFHRESSDGDHLNSSDDDDDMETFGSDDRRHDIEAGVRGSRRRAANQASSDRTSLTTKKSCSSCGTKKTPYWREGWEPSVVLCNACGIRYQKYKKYCTRCVAIARKDDKGRLHCPECRLRL